jgi:adenylate cyclase
MSAVPDGTLADLRQTIDDLRCQLAERAAERDEALEQQAAMAEVLGVVNSSPRLLAPVFDAILEKTHKLCGVAHGALVLREGEILRAVAVSSASDAFAERLREGVLAAGNPVAQPLLDGARFVHILDQGEIDHPMMRAAAEQTGAGTVLAVPLRKDSVLLGAITAVRPEVRPFTEKQIALLENFAAQAVIAIENARLLGELRQRTHDLERSLEYQTATSNVLQVISRSDGEIRSVLDTMVETATRICVPDSGLILRLQDDGKYHIAASVGCSPEFLEHHARSPTLPGRGTVTGRAAIERRVVQIEDAATDPEYIATRSQRLGQTRTMLGVPLLRDGTVTGVITLFRQRVEAFTERQIELVRTFADQAVIAMENARLLGELRARTTDLEQSLEYQTAASDVLKAISRSTFDLQPVLDTLCETAARLCAAERAHMVVRDSEVYRPLATFAVSPEHDAFIRTLVFKADGTTVLGRTVSERKVIHVADIQTEPAYASAPGVVGPHEGRTRTVLGVPLLRRGDPIGAIALGRQRVEPFTKRQIALVQTFADQAVIALENTRLLGELRASNEEIAELNRGLEARVAAQVDELGRVGRLKRFLAPQLAEMIIAKGEEGVLESHRREIVVVFCDLRGYTAFTETAEPEDVLDFLREYHGALGPLVSQFEGTLDQFSGDGIMVFFNDPVPCPDPAERAVKMAIAMREAASKLIAAWRRRHASQLGFGVGIAQGYATLGQIGFSERSGYTAIGTVCNLASRLCATAKDGQILVSSRVAGAVEGIAKLEDLGNLEVKGLSRPVAAFNLAGSVSK